MPIQVSASAEYDFRLKTFFAQPTVRIVDEDDERVGPAISLHGIARDAVSWDGVSGGSPDEAREFGRALMLAADLCDGLVDPSRVEMEAALRQARRHQEEMHRETARRKRESA